MSTTASVLKYWAYIAGIQIPVSYVNIVNMHGDMTYGILQTQFSPFLIHLPKTTKLTIFGYDSSVDEEPVLEFDGTITQITESISNTGVALNLGFSSDGHIWKLRNRVMAKIESFFSSAQLRALSILADGKENVQSGINNGITDYMTDIFAAADNDTSKAAMIFLTGMFRPPTIKDDPKSGYYYVNGNTQKVMKQKTGKGSDELMSGDFYDVAHNDFWPAFIQRYYEVYNLPYKMAYISQASETFMKENYLKSLIGQGLDSSKFGYENYWNLACKAASCLDAEVISVPDATFNNGHLIEFIAKPISPLGALPLCNIVYPNQIQQYTHTKNFFAEPTRVMTMATANAFMQNDNMQLFSSFNCGPTLKGGELEAFAIPQGAQLADVAFSPYEKEYGINAKNLSGPHLTVVCNVESTSNKDGFRKILNHEFVKHYFGSKEFSLSVSPNNRYVIGMTMAVLRRDLHHTLAYLFGTTKTWDSAGQSTLQLHLAYSRQYDFPIDENIHEFVDGFEKEENRKMYARHVGLDESAVVKAGPETLEAVESAFKEWKNVYDQSPELMKAANRGKYRRRHCTYSEFCQFMDSDLTDVQNDFDILDLTMPAVMPEPIVDQFDSSDEAAKLSTAKYYYYDPFTEVKMDAEAVYPLYSEIGEDGPITPSTYVSGIVNCHLRYLKDVAHAISY